MSVARAYAKALFEAAQEMKASRQDLEAYEVQLGEINRVIEISRPTRTALLTPALPSKEKVNLVSAIAEKSGMSKAVTNFLVLLARKERLNLLPEIQEAYRAVSLEADGGILGSLVSAEPMEPSDVDGLARAFSQRLGKKVAFKTATDPSLLAGVKVTVNGVTYDGTLRAQLQRLRDRLVYGSSTATQ